jgi:hypothetical protein
MGIVLSARIKYINGGGVFQTSRRILTKWGGIIFLKA